MTANLGPGPYMAPESVEDKSTLTAQVFDTTALSSWNKSTKVFDQTERKIDRRCLIKRYGDRMLCKVYSKPPGTIEHEVLKEK